MTLTFFKQVEGYDWPILSRFITIDRVSDFHFLKVDTQGWVKMEVLSTSGERFEAITHMEHVSANFGISSTALGCEDVASVWERVPGPRPESARESAFRDESGRASRRLVAALAALAVCAALVVASPQPETNLAKSTAVGSRVVPMKQGEARYGAEVVVLVEGFYKEARGILVDVYTLEQSSNSFNCAGLAYAVLLGDVQNERVFCEDELGVSVK